MTSSMAAVTLNDRWTHDVMIDETWFSSVDFCERNEVC